MKLRISIETRCAFFLVAKFKDFKRVYPTMKHKLLKLIRLRSIGRHRLDWLRRMPAIRYLLCIARYRKAGISLIIAITFLCQQVGWACPLTIMSTSLRPLAKAERTRPGTRAVSLVIVPQKGDVICRIDGVVMVVVSTESDTAFCDVIFRDGRRLYNEWVNINELNGAFKNKKAFILGDKTEKYIFTFPIRIEGVTKMFYVNSELMRKCALQGINIWNLIREAALLIVQAKTVYAFGKMKNPKGVVIGNAVKAALFDKLAREHRKDLKEILILSIASMVAIKLRKQLEGQQNAPVPLPVAKPIPEPQELLSSI